MSMFKLMITLWRHASWLNRLTYMSVGLACIAAVITSLTPLWVTVALLVPSIAMQGVGLVIVRRQWEQQISEGDE